MTPEAALTKISYLLGRSDLSQESRIEVYYIALKIINSYTLVPTSYIEIII